MKIKVNDKVVHRRNHHWEAKVVKDYDPRRPVNGYVKVCMESPSGPVEYRVIKSILRKKTW